MTVLVKDTFTASDGTSLASHMADTGQSWIISEQSFTITSNQVGVSTSSETQAFIDSGYPDFQLSVTIVNQGYESDVYFRAVDSKNYLRVSFSGSTLYFQKCINGTKSTLYQANSLSIPANSQVVITCNGNLVSGTLNGSTLFNNVTATDFNTSTKCGIGTWNSTAGKFDNFEIDSLTTSGTTYIGSGTATGKSNLASNETLILSEHGTVTGQSNNTSNETFVGATGTTYSASGTVSGKSNLTSSETLILRSTGNAQGQSSLTSNEHEILSASGTIQGSSYLQSNENLIQHTGTIYSASGTVTGQSNASSHETMSLSANGEVKGQSSLTSNEKLIFFVTGIVQGQSSLKSNEKLISVKQIISRVTLHGSRELHVILEGNRELHVILKGGVDVPAENQNLTLEAGTDKIIDIPNIVDSASPLDLTTCLEVHYQAKSGSTVISKDLTNGITVTSPTDLSIALLPDDSHGLSGFFKHEVWCVDSNGKKSLLTKGNLIIKPSYADVN